MATIAAPDRAARPEEREPSRLVDAGRATTRAYEAVRERGARPRTLGCDDYSLFDDGLTLEGRILRVWEDLVVEGHAACPVCGGSMAAGSPCEGCGSELS